MKHLVVIVVSIFTTFLHLEVTNAQTLYPKAGKGGWAYYDKSGNRKTPHKFDEARSFKFGFAVVGQIKMSFAEKMKNVGTYESGGNIYYYTTGFGESELKLGVINAQGKLVVPIKYDEIEISETSIWVKKGKKSKTILLNSPELNKFIGLEDIGDFYDGIAVASKDEKYGFVDDQGKTVIPFEYDFASDLIQGRALVRKEGLWGFIDGNNQVTIPIQYQRAFLYNDGLALVKMNNKWGYINNQGQEIIPLKYDSAWSFTGERIAPVMESGKWGLIDTEGNYIKAPKYDYVGSYNQGLAKIRIGDRIGYIDTKGEEIIPPKYQERSWISHGLVLLQYEGKYGYLDTSGKIAIPFEYDEVGSFTEYPLGFDVFEVKALVKKGGIKGYLYKSGKFEPSQFQLEAPPEVKAKYDYVFQPSSECVVLVVSLNAKKGLIDTLGNEILPVEYDEVSVEEECSFKIIKNGKAGLANAVGSIILPLEYDEIKASGLKMPGIENNVFQVEKSGKSGLVNHKNEVLIPIEYDYAHPTRLKIAGIELILVRVEKSGKWGLVNLKNEELVPIEYESIYFQKVNNETNLIKARKGSLEGLITIYDEIVAPFQYERIEKYFDGMAQVRIDGKWGYINGKGELAIPCMYSYSQIFSSGTARVWIKKKVFYIDKSGQKIDKKQK